MRICCCAAALLWIVVVCVLQLKESESLSIFPRFRRPASPRRSFLTDGYDAGVPPFQSLQFSASAAKEDGNQTNTNILVEGNSPEAQALEYRKRAAILRAEATAMEAVLKDSRASQTERGLQNVNDWMAILFDENNESPADIARTIREEKLGDLEMNLLLESLFSRRATETNNNNNETARPVHTYMQLLLDAAGILDEQEPPFRRWSGRVQPKLLANLQILYRAEDERLRQRVAAASLRQTDTGAPLPASATTLPQPIRSMLLGFANNNATSQNSSQTLLFPRWVPSTLHGPLRQCSSNITAADFTAIEDRVLARTPFYCTSIETTKDKKAAIFRGNLRDPTASADVDTTADVFAEMERGLERVGLSDRVQLFFVPDPQWQPPSREGSATATLEPKPVVLAVPRQVTPIAASAIDTQLVRPALGVASLATAFMSAFYCYALNPRIYNSVMTQHSLRALFKSCWPVVGGLVALHGMVYQVAHRAVAKLWKIRLKWQLPLFFPGFSHGVVGGGMTPLHDFLPNRSAAVDLSLSGPVATGLVSVLCMSYGCYRTVYASPVALLNFPVVPAAYLKSSFLAGHILSLLLPKAMLVPCSQPIPIHPLFLVGFSGAIASAVNLLPISRLDGGRACTAAMGKRFAAIVSAWTLLSLLGLFKMPFFWGLAAFTLMPQRLATQPTNDVTPISDVRIVAWALSLVFSMLTLLPFPGGAGRL